MAGLLKSILHRGGWLTFVTLQVICAIIIVYANATQREVWQSSSDLYLGMVSQARDNMLDYYTLNDQIEELRTENAALRSRLETALYRPGTSVDTAALDSSLQRFSIIPAEVISKTPPGNNNFFTINRGRRALVEPHMGVVGDRGVVGIVVSVTERFAKVMTLLHSQSRLSVRIRNTSYFGTLVWPGGRPSRLLITDIPLHATIQPADTVETSGYSYLFPAQIPLGRVIAVAEKSDHYEATVEMFDNILDTESVYVIRDEMRPQIDTLIAVQ